MREILFRGKREDNDEWVYGYYVKLPDAAGSVGFMHVPASNPDEHNTAHYVAPETVGQYTGLTDKNGVKIFEGDILRIGLEEDDYIVCQVYEYRGVLCVDYETADWDFNALGFLDNDTGYIFEVIGNIHDNPELIGGKR